MEVLLVAPTSLENIPRHTYMPSLSWCLKGMLLKKELDLNSEWMEGRPGLFLLWPTLGKRTSLIKLCCPHRYQGCQPRGSLGAYLCGRISPRLRHTVCICWGQTHEVLDPGWKCAAIQERGHRVHGGCQNADNAVRGFWCCKFQQMLSQRGS